MRKRIKVKGGKNVTVDIPDNADLNYVLSELKGQLDQRYRAEAIAAEKLVSVIDSIPDRVQKAVQSLKISAPEVKIPNIAIPEIKIPEIKIPPAEAVKFPEIKIPETKPRPSATMLEVADVKRDESGRLAKGTKIKVIY